MWTAVVVMAVAVIFEPIRIGLGVLMLNRPRPLLQLAVFLCGGFAMGIGVGLAVLFLLRTTPLAGTDTVSVAGVQIAVGIAVLLVAAWIAVARVRPAPVPQPAIALAGNGTGPAPVAAVAANDRSVRGWVRRTLTGDSLWVAWVAGMGTALPSANYLGAMAVILASDAAAPAQALALVLFNVVAFTLVELPLLSYLVAPQRTLGVMAALHTWLATRPRRDIALLVAASGCVVLVLGLAQL
ncbi:GAP family protein [[Mycobacterium] burgundiense]|uniref:GAP family protein n=1 Tax=[Mycobacterium] burgundiense TaxID=3064286 RepID=A0ABM9LTF4_9MYCO|nr:GAP family protein [Mycolicibacterium sp. MU0053]CAJ1504381.1 GAP family protein [Mycolicibacterium sp. MU0053]